MMTWHYLDDNCEHSTYSPGLAAESSETCCSATIPSALSKLIPTVSECSCNDSETECCHDSQSGMTCGHLMGERGEGRLMSSAEGFRAKTLAQPEKDHCFEEHGRKPMDNLVEAIVELLLSAEQP